MKAAQARERLKNNTQIKQNNELEKIYEKIKQAVEFGLYNTFIPEFNISNNHKTILELEGYFIDTRYTNGFQVRWKETDMDYFLNLLSSNKEYAKLKVDDDVIENYKNSAF